MTDSTVDETRSLGKGVFAAVAAAKGEIKRIAKDNRNAEQKYDFASIDDFMAMVGPITAKHGLVTIIDEESLEFIEKQGKFGTTFWAKIAYQITTFHIDGSSLPTVRRHIEVIRSGPQAYGSAQSYILKQYNRGLYEIPTGEKDDPDFGSQPVEMPKRDFEREVQNAIKAMEKEPKLDSLRAFFEDLKRQSFDVAEDQRVIDAKDKRKAALAATPYGEQG